VTEGAPAGVRRAPTPAWLDGTVVVAGLVALGVGFLPWYAASAGVIGQHTSLTLFSKNAWELGVLAWLGIVFAVWAAAAALLQRVLGATDATAALAPTALAALLAAAGLALVLIRILTLPRAAGGGHGVIGHEGPAVGAYIALAALVVQLGFACARLLIVTRQAARSAPARDTTGGAAAEARAAGDSDR
jgi:hypothetical protein